ncbi:MAG: gliding motility-associated C-terminal domain-containing protein [Saprospiraceae bacterium]|nr:gliding motility-associated C-terminal domain-containing protein [Saprospiraceae bacterium]
MISQTYYVNVTSAIGCHYLDSIFVDLIPISSIEAGNDITICKGETVLLKGRALGAATWTSNTNEITNQNSLSITAQPDQSSTYFLQSISDECVLNDSIVVKVITKTEVSAIGDTICPTSIAQVSAFGFSESYVWYQGAQIVGTGDTLRYTPAETTSLVVIGSKGLCQTDTADVNIFVFPSINYTIIEKEFDLFLNSKVNIKAQYDKDADYLFTWTPKLGLSCDDCPEPSIKNIENSTNYTVEIVDEFGCLKEDQVFVRFTNECSRKGFYIPNIFNPNSGDGTNELFKVFAENENEFLAISIFDRWGNLVFTADDIDKPWNGMYRGRALGQGVYTYIITAKCPKSNETYNFVGDITIIN